MKKAIYLFFLIVTCASCAEFYHPHFKEVSEFVIAVDSLDKEGKHVDYFRNYLYVNEFGGDEQVKVYSTGEISVSPVDEACDWISVVAEDRTEGRSVIQFQIDPNGSYRRLARFEVVHDGGKERDTLRFYQYGKDAMIPSIVCRQPYVSLDIRNTLSASFPIETGIALTDIKVEVTYSGGADQWLTYEWADGPMLKATVESTDADSFSYAVMKLSFDDAWGAEVSKNIRVVRSDADGGFGQPKTFEEIRAMATPEGYELMEDIMIEGVIISDCESANMELNPSIAYDKVDTLESRRTAYVQSVDGRYGFRLKFDNAAENDLRHGYKVKLLLNGTVLTREAEPERYSIGSMGSGNILGGEMTSVSPKQMTIASLTDADIYTYVQLSDTEFLNKKGAYTNVKEEFSLPSPFNLTSTGKHTKITAQMDGWASMLADKDGNVIYAMINMMCPWRRTGGGVPQGTGPVTGIIVHNRSNRYGDMGRYQIRVLDESGFGQSRDGTSCYESYLTWGYYEGKRDDYSVSVVGNGKLINENAESGSAFGKCQSFNALKTWHIVEETQREYPGIIPDAAFRITGDVSGWYEWNEDGSVKDYRGVRVETSTSGLAASDRLYVYVSFCENGTDGTLTTFKNFPSHWCLKWSDGVREYQTIAPSADTGKEYVHLLTAPWSSAANVSVRYETSGYSGMGFTEHLFELPSEALGLEKLYVRLCPYDTCMSVMPLDWNSPIETGKVMAGTDNLNDLRFSAIEFLVKKQ